MTSWTHPAINAVLMDITGVLYDSGEGDGIAIEGSIEAVNRLKSSGIAYRFVSNETSHSRESLVARLRRLGFDVELEEVFTPAAATKAYIKEHKLKPHYLIHAGLMGEFDDTNSPTNATDCDCVIIGDAADAFTWSNMNECLQRLLAMKKPMLITMGNGRYYKETDGIKLDVGAYSAALQFACDVKPIIIGKPSKDYFNAALADIGKTAAESIMIGDDIVSDVGGAQQCGLRGISVRTGKWQPSWANHATVTPDGVVANLSEAVDIILNARV